MNLLITNEYLDHSERDKRLPIGSSLWVFNDSDLYGCYGGIDCSCCPLRISTDNVDTCNESITSLIYDIYKRSNQKELIFTFDESTHPEFFL